VLAALFLVYVNTKQATRVLSLSSEAASEAKQAEIARGSHLASQGSQWVARRKVQVELAGETPVAALEAQMQALQLGDLRAWSATKECADVTIKASAAFCTKVAQARARVAAAKERDRIDAELAKLPTPKVAVTANAEAPVADAYVANVVSLLKEAGFRPSERLVKAEEALARAFSFELLAALGPTCWLAFVNMLAAGGAAVSERMRKAAPQTSPRKRGEAPVLPAPAEPADDLDRAIADLFESEPAGVMSAKQIRPIVEAWFATKGLKLDESKLWPRMGERFKRDPNNGRPRYFGLKVRVKGPPKLAVVRA
jgi:hypothetical protein